MLKDSVLSGSSVVERAWLVAQDLELGKWHRSKERKGGDHFFGSYMLNKKWTYEEEFNKHLLRFQQVTVSSIYLS